MVVENDFSDPSYRNRQQCSVPFLWEERPGTPKREWKPDESIPVKFVASPAAKLSVSVPFKWEEKPGKPLAQFSQAQTASRVFFPSPPTHYSPSHSKLDAASPMRNNPFLSIREDINGRVHFADANDGNEDDGMLELDLYDPTFQKLAPGSAPSLLANRLLTTGMVSSSVPVRESALRGSSGSERSLSEEDSDQHGNWESSGSDAAGDSTQYNSAGDSVLDVIFPLFSPDSSFLNKVIHQEKKFAVASPDLLARDNGPGSNCSLVVRKPRTLGELIQLSRRISCPRTKVVNKRQTRLKNMGIHLLHLWDSIDNNEANSGNWGSRELCDTSP
ncbi:hypothetical protein ACLOJK_005307 [Asimina triloba]